MLREVNKISKDNPISSLSFFYILPPPAYFDPPV